MKRDNFLADLFVALAAEALGWLPDGSWLLDYNDHTFRFLQRTDAGEVYLHKVTADPLRAIRQGFRATDFEKTQITPSTWQPKFGLQGAPDGTYATCTTDPGNDWDESLTSYGVIRGGGYHRLHGRNWGFVPGWRPRYARWSQAARPATVREDGVYLSPDRRRSYPDAYHADPDIGADTTADVLGARVNEALLKSVFTRRQHPSPDYYNPARWTYAPGADDAPGVWSFV